MLETVKIKKIVKTENEKQVYDISVDGSQHYLLESGIVSHNSGPIFAASMVVGMKKGKLKEDADGNKTKDVSGIRALIHIVKSRYSKPFERAEINIPYDSGMDPYSGLIEFFESRGVFKKEGNSLIYTDVSGKVHKNFRKRITKELLDQIMCEWDEAKYGFKGNNSSLLSIDESDVSE